MLTRNTNLDKGISALADFYFYKDFPDNGALVHGEEYKCRKNWFTGVHSAIKFVIKSVAPSLANQYSRMLSPVLEEAKIAMAAMNDKFTMERDAYRTTQDDIDRFNALILKVIAEIHKDPQEEAATENFTLAQK